MAEKSHLVGLVALTMTVGCATTTPRPSEGPRAGKCSRVDALDCREASLNLDAAQKSLSVQVAEPKLAKTSPPVQRSPAGPAPPTRTVTADTDPHQLRDGVELSPTDSLGWCEQMFGEGALCATIAQGPLYLTDAAPKGAACQGQFLAVMTGDRLEAQFDSPVRMHGARIFIPTGHTLVYGQRAEPKREERSPESDRKDRAGVSAPSASAGEAEENVVLDETSPEWSCLLYWSGFVPYNAERRGNETWTKESGL